MRSENEVRIIIDSLQFRLLQLRALGLGHEVEARKLEAQIQILSLVLV